MQVDLPAEAEYVPTPQLTQAADELEPVFTLNVPAGQATQAAAEVAPTAAE